MALTSPGVIKTSNEILVALAPEITMVKQFTYDINKRKAGIYWDFLFELDPLKLIEIKNKYKLNEKVLRSMTIVSERPEGLPVVAALNLE